MKLALISSIFLASANLAHAAPVTINLFGNYNSETNYVLDDFDIPGVVDFTSNMGLASWVLAEKTFTGLAFTTDEYLRLDFSQPVFSFTLDTIRVTDLRFSSFKELGHLNGIAYKENAEQQMLKGELDSEDRSFTFVTNDNVGFSTITFNPISPVFNYIDPDTGTIEGSYNIISGIDSVTFDTSTPIPEPETYALMLTGIGMLGLIRRRRN